MHMPDTRRRRTDRASIATERPNILIIVPEQWRGDLTGYAGHPVIRTPNVDGVAEDGGLAFTRAFTTNPICGPSRCGMLSGWYPHTRGHRTQRYLLGPREPNLMRDLKQAGYRTAMIGKNDVLHHSVVAESLDLAGVPARTDPPSVRRTNPYAPEDPRYYTFLWGPEPFPAEQHPDCHTNRSALAFIDAVAGHAPFCCWLNYELAHPPYRVEEPWWSMYEPAHVGNLAAASPPAGIGAASKPVYVDLLHRAHRLHELPEQTLFEIRARYMGMISRADALIGELLAGLDDRGLRQSTALFIVADHGNYGGDYGLPAKWWTGMEDALLRVPLVARIPNQVRTGVCHELVQHLDLNQTIRDLAGVPPRHATSSRSLVPLLRGAASAHRDHVIACSGHWLGQEAPLDLDRSQFVTLDDPDHLYYPWKQVIAQHPDASCRTFAIRDAHWKYVWRSHDVDELYDLQADPLEERNLLGGYGDAAPDGPAGQAWERLRARLLNEVFLSVDAVPLIYPDEPGSVHFTPTDRLGVWTTR